MSPYIQLLIAALNEVPQEYYKLRTTYDAAGIVRERVFCYEFYHHLRCIQDEHKDILPLIIHGEIDKQGHELFDSDDRKNPDFVFHIPGEMENNTIVVEVKGKLEGRNYIEGAIKDLKTLTTFIGGYQYKIGVFIVLNYSIAEVADILRCDIMSKILVLKAVNEKILIICKKNARSASQLCTLMKIMESR